MMNFWLDYSVIFVFCSMCTMSS